MEQVAGFSGARSLLLIASFYVAFLSISVVSASSAEAAEELELVLAAAREVSAPSLAFVGSD